MDTDFQPRRRAPDLSAKTGAPSDTKNQSNISTFRTPEEVAAAQNIEADSKPQSEIQPPPAQVPTKPKWRRYLTWHWPPGRKEWITFGLAALVIIAIGSALILTHHSKPVVAVVKHAKYKAPPVPTIVPSTLSGLPVAPSINQLPVTGVMIENSFDARPQSGLSQASVVFEAVAEGGVTRFLTLFQDTSPDNVGPIRSARPYYVQWDLGFDGAYAHVGGSPDGLADIKTWSVRDLDEFANSGSYHRVSTRYAPHNVYTAISTLNQLETKKGFSHSTFSGFPRKIAAPIKPPTANTINMTLSGPTYNVHYDYAAATNSYNRSEGGSPHIDANTNLQISPKVVVAMVVPKSQGALDATGAYYSDYAVIGSGAVYIFQDGTVTVGQWSKSSNTAQISFTDSKGQVIKLNPGQTWLTAIADASAVNYAP